MPEFWAAAAACWLRYQRKESGRAGGRRSCRGRNKVQGVALLEMVRNIFDINVYQILDYLGLRPETFSALLSPERLWYESLSVFLSLLEDGADTEMVWPRGRWPPLGEIGPGCAGAAGNSNLILAPPF